ncbi:fimbrial biogenesis usher protein [Serratia aquatilis]|uniref:Fimbrial biogenesis usher protein n=1 Tax=Serratia aquatilis TaxID=1737515 RepID=A0ABV6EH89_9GAMM
MKRSVRRDIFEEKGLMPHFSSLAAALMAILYSGMSSAESYFNPAFLSDDVTKVSDLSRFEKGTNQAPGTYRVEIIVNEELVATQDMNFIAAPSGASIKPSAGGLEPCMDQRWLKRIGVNIAAHPNLSKLKPEECVDLVKEVTGAEVTFDFARQRLTINIPQASLLNAVRGYIPPEEWDEGIPAVLLNYNASGNSGSNGDSYYLNLQSGANAGAWRLRNNSSWSYSTSSDGTTYNRWKSIGTYVQRAIIPLKSTLVMGESNTNNSLFDSTGFRGARMYSTDSMYPDALQGFAPTVRGIARSNAKITIRQNGFVIYQNFVPPGPFVIDDMNARISSGDLEVTVEERDGNNQVFTVPYSTVPMLLREGRFKYDVVVGTFRSGNSQQSEPGFSQLTLIGGLPNGYTVYGGGQIAARYAAAAIGIGKNLGNWGAISFDATHAYSKLADDSTYDGQSVRFLYAKSLNEYGTNFRVLGYRYSTQGFHTLSDVAYKQLEGYDNQLEIDGNYSKVPIVATYYNLRYNRKQNFQANITQSLGEYGSLYLSGNQQTYWGTTRTNVMYQLGYSSGWRGINYALGLAWNKTLDTNENNRIASLNVSIPFSVLFGRRYSTDSLLDRAYATVAASRDSNGKNTVRTGLSGTLLEGRNLAYSVTQNSGSTSGGNVNLNWQGTYNTLGLGYSYGRGQHDLNWQVAGGVVGHADGVTFSQPLGDTNVLIKAPGAAGVRVENQTGVRTDWRGYAVVPYASNYRYNRIALDTNSMDQNTDITDNVANVVPTEGAVVRATFDPRIGVRALFTVKRGDNLVPFGAMVREETTGTTSMVGEDGQLYMSGLPLQGKFLISWGKDAGSQCKASYSLPKENLKQAVMVATATCN